jgi:hypothetical protein
MLYLIVIKMANYSPLTKFLTNYSVKRNIEIKKKSPFEQQSWIHQEKDMKKETPQEETKNSVGLIKPINNYEVKCFYKINNEGYYKNVPIYRENRNKYITKTKKY